MLKILGKADSWLDVGMRWGTAFGLAWAGLSWLAKRMTWLGAMNWADAVALGLGGAMALSLVVSAALVAIRFFRPLPANQMVVKSPPALDYDPGNGATSGGEWSYDDLNPWQKRVEKLLSEKTSSIQDLARKIESVRVDGAQTKQSLGKIDTLHKKDREQTLMAFLAMRHLRIFPDLEATIRRDASDLYDRLRSGEVYGGADWEQWENVHTHWNDQLNTWLELARWYAVAVKERVLTVDDAKYGAEWTVQDTQFPNAEAVRRFKKFRIIQQQWEEVAPDVCRGMEQVAFSGLTDSEVRRGSPAG